MKVLAVCSILSVVWFYREYSWYTHRQAELDKLTSCVEKVTDLQLRLNVEELVQFKCDNSTYTTNKTSALPLDNVTYCTHDISSFLESQQNTPKKHFVPPPILNDKITLLQILFSCCLILYEYNYIHDLNNEGYERRNTILGETVQRRVKEFLLRRFPVTSVLFFSCILLVSSITWLGFINRSFFVQCALKLVVNWIFAGPLAFMINSFFRLRRYFPELKDKETWASSLKDGRWWFWLVSRLMGIDDLPSGTEMLLWMASLVWYAWPLRYFYLYAEIGCKADCHAANDLFLLNALMHNALSICCSYVLYLLALVPTAVGDHIPQSVTPPVDSTNPTEPEVPGPVNTAYTNPAMRWQVIMTGWLQNINTMSRVAAICLLSLSSSLICFVRLVWFFAFGGCTWYGSMCAWMLLHLQLGIFLSTLPCVNALVDKYSLMTTHKEVRPDLIVTIHL